MWCLNQYIIRKRETFFSEETIDLSHPSWLYSYPLMTPCVTHAMAKVCVRMEQVKEYIIAAINQYDAMSKSDWFSLSPLNPLHNLNMASWRMHFSNKSLKQLFETMIYSTEKVLQTASRKNCMLGRCL